MVQCEVKYNNNPNGVYYSGQTLSGVIELHNDKPRKIRGLSLRIEGFAKCKWTESEGTGKHRRTIHYSGREDYMDTFSYLIGNYDVTQAELSAGAHKFNFSCVLPPQLPTSFESKYGYIRYQIKVEMERPWKYDIKHCFAFTVIKVLDLNYESPALRSPLKREATKNFFFGLSSKTLFISAEIPMSGYVAGQNVAISITVNNETTTDVEETKFQLMKIIHYNSQTPRRKIRQRVEMAAEVKNVGVPAKSKGFVQAHLIIPPVPPTNLAYCRVLQVSYEIQFVACVGGIHRNPVLRLPLTIGTVPLQNNYYQPAPTTTMPLTAWNIQHAGSSNAQPSAQLPLYPALPVPQYPMETRAAPMPPGTHDLPPPSYHEAMGMPSQEAEVDDGIADDKPFSPMYPVYNFNSQAPAAAAQPAQSRLTEPPPSYSNPLPNYGYPEKRSI